MDNFIQSIDNLKIHYQVSGAGPRALVFVHGWLGNSNWWNYQRDHFKDEYTVVQIDLPGHGKSEKRRGNLSSTQYALDIKNVVDQIEAEKIILVGHSMFGAYVLEASLHISRTRLVVLVDTIKNMDRLMDLEQANKLILDSYRSEFQYAVRRFLPKFLFTETTPIALIDRLQSEFLQKDGEFAAKSIEPLYKMNIRELSMQVRVPVRAINSNLSPTHPDSIRSYLKDYEYVTITGSGHYPMLERPVQFNILLEEMLQRCEPKKYPW